MKEVKTFHLFFFERANIPDVRVGAPQAVSDVGDSALERGRNRGATWAALKRKMGDVLRHSPGRSSVCGVKLTPGESVLSVFH